MLEKRALPGGLNTTGVAPYKLHAEESLCARSSGCGRSGVEHAMTASRSGKDVTAAQLLAEYDAVFLGLGLGEDTQARDPGRRRAGRRGGHGVDRADEARRGQREPKLGHVVVVGGGNTAIDVARECAAARRAQRS